MRHTRVVIATVVSTGHSESPDRKPACKAGLETYDIPVRYVVGQHVRLWKFISLFFVAYS